MFRFLDWEGREKTGDRNIFWEKQHLANIKKMGCRPSPMNTFYGNKNRSPFVRCSKTFCLSKLVRFEAFIHIKTSLNLFWQGQHELTLPCLTRLGIALLKRIVPVRFIVSKFKTGQLIVAEALVIGRFCRICHNSSWLG